MSGSLSRKSEQEVRSGRQAASMIMYYGHENEMYIVGVNLKEGEGLKMRELRVDWEKMGDKTKCAKG